MIYLTVLKYLAPVVLFVAYTVAVYQFASGGEKQKCDNQSYQSVIGAHEAASKFTAGILTDNQETQDDGQIQIELLKTQLAAADFAYDSLHDSVKAHAKRAADSSRAAANCKATEAANRVFADMLQQSDQRAGVYAKHADESRIAGLACEKAADDLKKWCERK